MSRRRDKKHYARTRAGAVFVLLAVALAAPVMAQRVDVRPSTTHLYADQTLFVDVLITGSPEAAEPKPLASRDFEILAFKNNPIRDDARTAVVSGTTRRVRDLTYRFEAKPLRDGTLILPPFEIWIAGRVQHTQQIAIAVSKETTDSLLICEVETQFATAYVGQPFEVALRVWIRIDQQPDFVNSLGQFLWDARFRDEAATRLGIFKGVDMLRARFTANVPRSRDSTHRYHVFELRKTFYPSQPGVLDWGDIAFAYHYPTSLSRDPFGGLRLGEAPLRLSRSPRLPRVEIKPLPATGQPAGFRGAIGEYAISTVAAPLEVTLGDPITLTIEIAGRGLDRLRPPDPASSEEFVRDFEIVPDDPAGEIFGTHKLFARTIRPRRLDVDRIPSLPFSYFDPATGRYETVHSEPISILVRPRPLPSVAEGGEASSTQTAPETPTLAPIEEDPARVLLGDPARINWGLWLCVVPMPLACAWVWWRRRSRAAAMLKQKAERRRRMTAQLVEACSTSATPTARSIRDALLAYTSDCSSRPGISDRQSAAEFLAESGVSPESIAAVDAVLARLDRAAYGGAANDSGDLRAIATDAIDVMRLIEADLSR